MTAPATTSTTKDPARLCLHAAPESVSAARRHVRTQLSNAGCTDSVVDDAVVIASELVTNAVVYVPDTPIEVWACRAVHFVIVAVRDSSDLEPEARNATYTDEHGRGIAIVKELSAECGTFPARDGGKVVWAVLTADGGPLKPIPAPETLLEGR